MQKTKKTEDESITLSKQFRIFSQLVALLEEGSEEYSVDELRLDLNKLDEKLEKLG
jgi:hypothetical protein